jgi:putative tricarboxylic transport membrane protein
MTTAEDEIVVEDVDAPSPDAPTVTTLRTVDVVVSLLLLAFAGFMAWDNWRTGMSWAPEGPEAGYFPFYLSILLGGASCYGLFAAYRNRRQASEAFVTRDQLRRVLQVAVPTFLFCLFTQWLGLYVASCILIAGFMTLVGRIAPWKSVLTGLLFSILMFVTFEIAFDVIMPKGPVEALFGY